MKIVVRLKSFRGVSEVSKHFLTRERSLKVTAAGLGVSQELPVTSQADGFSFDLVDPQTSQLELNFELFLTHEGVQRRILRIVQTFGVMPTAGGNFALLPKGWSRAPSGGAAVSLHTVTNQATPLLHPLLAFDASSQTVLVNALMVDITDFWFQVHGAADRKATRYALWRDFSSPARANLRVLAHLGGHPFVWFVIVPQHLLLENDVAPHVFHLPADFGDIEYSATTLAGLTSTAHDLAPPLWYIESPVEDAQVSGRQMRAGQFRGAYHVSMTGKGEPIMRHFDIGAGLAKALSDSRARQVIFVPQRSSKGVGHAHAVTPHISNIVESALNLIWTNQKLLSQDFRRPLTIDKLVLSGFSDSGISLWSSAWTNMAKVKAIIAVEPEHMTTTRGGVDLSGVNKTGLEVITKLFRDADEKQQAAPTVCVIGRYRSEKYRLPLAASDLKRIAFFPSDANYDKTWVYPPAPAPDNPWNTYRVYRLLHPTQDPLMRVEEEEIVLSLLAKGKTPEGFLRLVFPDAINHDDLSGHYFSHMFAMAGGQELTLPPFDPEKSYYDAPVAYKTFFQEALERIG